jgi:putative endonuclease
MLRAALGAAGEAAAERYLVAAGMRAVDRDVRLPEGQVDLVMEDGGTLVVVEVKARRGAGFGLPEEGVDARKLGRLRRLAAAVARRRGGAARGADLDPERPGAGGVRVDVVAVDLDRHGAVLEIRHVRDALA